MLRPLLLLIVLICFSAIGCEKAPEVIPGAKNGGSMSPLAGGKGYVEVRLDIPKPVGANKAGGKKAPGGSIVAYFYGPDGSSSMSPAPTEVSIDVGAGNKVALEPNTADGSFPSIPGDYPDGLRGTLSAKIGAESITSPISVR